MSELFHELLIRHLSIREGSTFRIHPFLAKRLPLGHHLDHAQQASEILSPSFKNPGMALVANLFHKLQFVSFLIFLSHLELSLNNINSFWAFVALLNIKFNRIIFI